MGGGGETRSPRPRSAPQSPLAPGPRNNRWSRAAVQSAGSAGAAPFAPRAPAEGAAKARGEERRPRDGEGLTSRWPPRPPGPRSWCAPPPPLSSQPHTKRWRPGPAGRGSGGLRCRREQATARRTTHHEVPGEVVLPIVVRTLHGLDPLDKFPQDLHLLHPPASPRLRWLAPPPPPARPAQSPLSLPQLASPALPLPPDPRQASPLPVFPHRLRRRQRRHRPGSRPHNFQEQPPFSHSTRRAAAASANPNPQLAPSSFPALLLFRWRRRHRLRNSALRSPCPPSRFLLPPSPLAAAAASPHGRGPAATQTRGPVLWLRPRRWGARSAPAHLASEPLPQARPAGPSPSQSGWKALGCRQGDLTLLPGRGRARAVCKFEEVWKEGIRL